MTFPRLALSVIGDEIGPSLEEMISFAQEHGLKRLDMRTIDGRNLLGMTTEEVIAISNRLEKAGISVPTFVSPLFKWPADGKEATAGKVDFAFDPKLCPVRDVVTHAAQVAVILNARHMRVFSYLRHPGFKVTDILFDKHYIKLMGLADMYDIAMQVENEPVCNIGNIGELAKFFTDRQTAIEEEDNDDFDDDESEEQREAIERAINLMRPLVDIANGWSTGERPSDADIATLAPLVTALHLKDRDLAANRTVPLGDGNIPWPAELKRLLGGSKAKEILVSIETHCPQDARNATARSVAGFRRIAAEIGVEVV